MKLLSSLGLSGSLVLAGFLGGHLAQDASGLFKIDSSADESELVTRIDRLEQEVSDLAWVYRAIPGLHETFLAEVDGEKVSTPLAIANILHRRDSSDSPGSLAIHGMLLVNRTRAAIIEYARGLDELIFLVESKHAKALLEAQRADLPFIEKKVLLERLLPMLDLAEIKRRYDDVNDPDYDRVDKILDEVLLGGAERLAPIPGFTKPSWAGKSEK